MINPLDGALFAGSALVNTFAFITGNSPVLVAVVTGIFICLAKAIESLIRTRHDNRLRELERENRELRNR